MNKNFDVIVIGAGPGGYIAAIRSAQLGYNTACIDEWKNIDGNAALGGTCTNVGCIPSKALLQSSEYYEYANHTFFEHGIEIKNLSLNLNRMLARKNAVIKQNNEGIRYLFKKNKVTFFHGHGNFIEMKNNYYKINVTGINEELLIAKHIIIATGSTSRTLSSTPFDEKLILSNIGALNMIDVPKKLGIIGAGVIGLEIGSIWHRLGAEVTIFEVLPTFLNSIDEQIANEAYKLFNKQGLNINLGIKINNIKINKEDVIVSYIDNNYNIQQAKFCKLIVSIGRIPNTLNLNVENIGLKLDESGFIIVDDHCRTNLSNIWAIGDVVRGPMLAHKAEEEGIAVAECIAGQHGNVNFNIIPSIIYTSPEIACVGKTEAQLKNENIIYKIGVFPFLANGRARASGNTSGMVKLLADAKTDEILGVHIISSMASELISEAVVAMEFRASAEDIARICHAHPSLSEAMKEAALAIDNRTLNF